MIKRGFDIFFSFLGLLMFMPLFIVVVIFIKIESIGPVFFVQKKIGRNFAPFSIYMFRTMLLDSIQGNVNLSSTQKHKITLIGRILRKTKIDEILQLINIFKGEINFVGPRPEVQKYVELFRHDYEEILTIKPGITDLASIKYRNEEDALDRVHDPEKEYVRQILPEKIRLAKEYLKHSSLLFDMTLILKTLLKCANYKEIILTP